MTKQYFVRKRYDTLHYSTVSERYDTLHVLYCTNPASEPLHGPVDVAEDSLEGLHSAFRALSVEEVETQPVKRKRKREKDAGESIADEGADQGHEPTNDPTFEGAPSASGLHASPSPITTTLPTPEPAAATSTPITDPPLAEGTGFTGMPT